MPWKCCPQQEPSNFMDPELARLNALMRESTFAMNNLLHADMPWQYNPQQELSNSKDDELARLEALVREATYAMNNMLQQSTHWDTEVLMQEVQKQWEESSPMCGAQLEPPNQEHVDDKECPSELQQQIATTSIGEPEHNNATTIPIEAEKSNASSNSKEPDAEKVTTTLMLKQESMNCSYPELPRQLHEYMLGHQDDACLGDDTSSMVIPSDNGAARKSLLMEMLEKSEEISGYMLEDFRKDGPSLDLHRILATDCHDNWLELSRQRRLHPTMMKVEENKQEPSNFMDPELARLNAVMRESTVAMNNLLLADMPWQYNAQQELSNSKDDELARLEALVREATYAMNDMLQQSTHWDTEVLMQENAQVSFNNKLPRQVLGEPEHNNATTIPSEAEKSNASANSKKPDAENVTTMLMLKQESMNCSHPELPRQLHEYMLDHQDDACLGDDTSSMLIPSDNGAARKSLLMEMLEKSEEISGYMLEEFRKDGPSLDLHRILATDCHDNWLELSRQRRLHPTMMKVEENKSEPKASPVPLRKRTRRITATSPASPPP
ncbi:hypothetical protein GQ457_12G017710 [Hibiscus cannabinus]